MDGGIKDEHGSSIYHALKLPKDVGMKDQQWSWNEFNGNLKEIAHYL